MDVLKKIESQDKSAASWVHDKGRRVRPYAERIGMSAVAYLLISSRNPCALTAGFLTVTTAVDIGQVKPSAAADDNSVLYPLAKRLCVVYDVLALPVLLRAITNIGSLGAMSSGAGAVSVALSLAWVAARGTDLLLFDGDLMPTALSCRTDRVKQIWHQA